MITELSAPRNAVQDRSMSRTPLRILWLGHFVPWPSTGNGALQRTHNLLRLAAREHDITLVAIDPDGIDRFAARAALQSLGVRETHIFQRPRTRSLLVGAFTRALVRSGSAYEHMFNSSEARRLVETIVRGFDLVYLDFAPLHGLLPTDCDVPVLCNHHNVESELILQRSVSGQRGNRLLLSAEYRRMQEIEQALLRRAVNIAVSEQDCAWFRAASPGSRVFEVPNGVDTDFFLSQASRSRASVSSFVFAGSMRWEPNLEAIRWLLAEIWPAVRLSLPQATLAILGGVIPRACWSGSLPEGVANPGFVPDVRPYYRDAAAFLCPINTGGGTRLKVLDALSMKLPLIATGFAVDGLNLQASVHYLSAETPSEFAQMCLRLSADPGELGPMVLAGRQHVVEHYSWKAIGEKFLEAVQTAAAS
jgi:polysaccharide biosynthesis protein PslH